MSEEIEYPSKERERAKVNVKVSAEVNTYLHDLYNQIQYEFCEQYEDEIKDLQKEIDRLNKEYERIYNENCKLRENHNINDITLLDENERLNNIINELEKELREGSFDVYFCSTNTQKTFKSNEIIIKSLILDKLKELKNGDNNE